MVEECLAYYTGINENNFTAVTVPFLKGRNALLRHVNIHGFVVFADPVVGVLPIVLIKEDLPAAVKFFKGMDFGDPDLRDERIAHLVEFFDFTLVMLIFT